MRVALEIPLDVAPEWRASLSACGLTTLEALFRVINDQSLSKPGLPSWRERIRHSLTHASSPQVVYVKRVRRPPFGEQVRRCLTGDPNHGTAWGEWTWLRLLGEAGIAAPTPIAYGEEMLGPWERRSAVVMGEVQGVSLERWCNQHRIRLPEAVRNAVADTVARFHALGVVHRDLYLSHVFCDDPSGESPRVSLIDLQRLRRMGRRRRRWVVKDLASLDYSTPAWAATPRERLRWFKNYLRVPRLRRTDRLMARWVMGKSERIRRRDGRRRLA